MDGVWRMCKEDGDTWMEGKELEGVCVDGR